MENRGTRTICSKGTDRSSLQQRNITGVEALLKSEAERKACELYRIYDVRNSDECSTVSVIRLDAFITGVVDSFHVRKMKQGTNDGG